MGFFQLFAHTQVATVAAGSNILSSSGSVSFSVGQLEYSSFGSSIILYLGVQQVYDPFLIPIDDNIGISVWPNPVSTTLHINITSTVKLETVFQLYAIDGKLMDTKKSSSISTSINMIHYAQATYVLMIRLSDKRTFKFKIIKK